MADPRHPPSRVYEDELTATVKSGGERWLTELRLAIFGIIISVGIGAADIGLEVGGWVGGLVGGVGSVVVLVGVFVGNSADLTVRNPVHRYSPNPRRLYRLRCD
jgi:hypothetical protein